MTKIEQWISGFAWTALVLSVIEIIMQSYGDYILFSLFVNDFNTFCKFNLINWPYYIFPLGIIIAVLKRQYMYLSLVVLMLPVVLKGQIHYLLKIWMHPNIITFPYATILAIIVIVMVLCALIAGGLDLYRHLNKILH